MCSSLDSNEKLQFVYIYLVMYRVLKDIRTFTWKWAFSVRILTVSAPVYTVLPSGCWLPNGPLSPDMDANYSGGLLDMVKGGAGKFFSNFKDNLKDTLKDTSTKVMHQVAT